MLKNKVTLITGSSIGIGRYTAYEFAKEQAIVIITYYKDKEEAIKTYKNCLELGMPEGKILYLNLKDNQSIKNCVKEVVDSYGQIDILINNAGVLAWKPLREQSFEEIENQVRVNLEGLIKFTKESLPFITQSIINIGSGAGKTAFPELTTYCATKFGVRGFTQALALEEPHINIYVVNPGMTATKMTGYKGVSPKIVAKVILNTAKGIYKKPSGSDIDVWEYY
ncbi:MAG: SDR family oxidoreductase [Aquificae bacterium]|nr:SDR family oxidoreductase [Aquificota bacterium]